MEFHQAHVSYRRTLEICAARADTTFEVLVLTRREQAIFVDGYRFFPHSAEDADMASHRLPQGKEVQEQHAKSSGKSRQQQ